MSDRPILFSGPMVRALLAGTKTQTRRVAKAKTGTMLDDLDWTDLPDGTRRGTLPLDKVAVPFAVGDRLYVREAWRAWWEYNDLPPSKIPSGADVQYVADDPLSPWDTRFRQGMHMPRWASRLTLTVTDVRVQRLQEISAADAIAEGIPPGANSLSIDCDTPDPRDSYRTLWDKLNADRGFGWSINPWVVAVSFSVARGNIDVTQQ